MLSDVTLLAPEQLDMHRFPPTTYELPGPFTCRGVCSNTCMVCCCPCGTACRMYPTGRVKAEDIEAKAGHRFVALPDGRLLEYTVGGDEESDNVVYFQHGYMLCGSMACDPTISAICKKAGIKIIAASMPGCGLSDSYPIGKVRTIKEWPADVLTILDRERVARTHIWSCSAGCVHAAALAYGLPSERVGNVCLGCPTAPDGAPGVQEGMSGATVVVKTLMSKRYIGDCLGCCMGKCMSTDTRMNAAPDVAAAMARAAVESPMLLEGIRNQFEESLTFTYRGIPDNFPTMAEDYSQWIPKLSLLIHDQRKIVITTAPDDTTNPPVMQYWFHEKVPGSVLMKFEPGWGHAHNLITEENIVRQLHFLKTGMDPEAK